MGHISREEADKVLDDDPPIHEEGDALHQSSVFLSQSIALSFDARKFFSSTEKHLVVARKKSVRKMQPCEMESCASHLPISIFSQVTLLNIK